MGKDELLELWLEKYRQYKHTSYLIKNQVSKYTPADIGLACLLDRFENLTDYLDDLHLKLEELDVDPFEYVE